VKKLLVLLLLIVIAGCTTTYRDTRSWEGHTVDELYWDMGSADKVENLGNGRRVFIYEEERTDKEGKVHTCRRSFTAVDYGNREEIIDTSYEDCPFITFKSH
jgi:hypothetical protein